MTAAEQILKMQNILHGNIGLIIALGVIVVLVIAIISLLVGRTHSKDSTRREETANKQEKKRREREGDRIKQAMEAELVSQDKALSSLKYYIRREYKNVSKTYLDISRSSHQNLFNTLQQLFDLEPNDHILYCRRYERTFGADSFLIIMEDKIGYAPERRPLGFLYFEDIDKFNEDGCGIQIMGAEEDLGYVSSEDFTYNNSGSTLAHYLNVYLKKYKSECTIYRDACFDALESKATSILPELICKLENYDQLSACFVRAGYKYILCEDGISIQDNWREASYDIENILSDPDVDK